LFPFCSADHNLTVVIRRTEREVVQKYATWCMRVR